MDAVRTLSAFLVALGDIIDEMSRDGLRITQDGPGGPWTLYYGGIEITRPELGTALYHLVLKVVVATV